MRLIEYLDESGISISEFARSLGVSRASIHKYCKLERVPSIPLLIRIKQETNGEVGEFEDWLDEDYEDERGIRGCRTQAQ